jgi:hypothetical protein
MLDPDGSFDSTHLAVLLCLEQKCEESECHSSLINSFLRSKSRMLDARRQLQAAAGGYHQARKVAAVENHQSSSPKPTKRARSVKDPSHASYVCGKELVCRELERRWQQHRRNFEEMCRPFLPLLFTCQRRIEILGKRVLGICNGGKRSGSRDSEVMAEGAQLGAELTLHVALLQLWHKLRVSIALALAATPDPTKADSV